MMCSETLSVVDFLCRCEMGMQTRSLLLHLEKIWAIHAGANIAMAVENFKNRGYATLGGLILNRRNVLREEEKVEELAEDFHTSIVGTLTRSDLVQQAEEQKKTVLEAFPESEMAEEYRILAKAILMKVREKQEVSNA